jgi:hypothetical protein
MQPGEMAKSGAQVDREYLKDFCDHESTPIRQNKTAGDGLRRRFSNVIYWEINYSGVQARFEEAGLEIKPRTPIYKTEKLPEIS